MGTTGDSVRFRDLARGVLQGLPDALTVQRGTLELLLMRPDRRDSIGALLARQALRHGGATALAFEDRRWTYAELNAWANRIAGALRARGVGPGAAVALMMENRPELLACVAGVVKLGAIAGMLNPQQRGDVLAHAISLTRAGVVVVGAECEQGLATTAYHPGRDRARTYFWDGDGAAPPGFADLRRETAGQPDDEPPETAAVTLAAPCFYVFTSGTTELSKASVMTHYRWRRSAAGMGRMAMRLRAADVLYCPLPLYHNNALTVSWGAATVAGATLALGRRFSASLFWDEVRGHRATAFCYVGELCRYLLGQPPSPRDRDHAVRLVVGNGLRPELWDAFQARFGIPRIVEFYGASEGNLVFVNGFGLSRTAGFCPERFAVVAFDAETERPVRGADGFLRPVAAGDVGLLLTGVSARNPFDGYTDAAASEAKLIRNAFATGDCWFDTGDLVRDQGWRHIQFVDRVGDTFRWKGENVATTEVEAALGRSPQIAEAVVYGVQVPNADGRAGMAAVTLRGERLDGAALAAELAALLPAYAVPVFLRLRDRHDTTPTFKFRKVDLKREGFDPARVSDAVYVLRDRRRGYEPLTAETYAAMEAGMVRL